MAVPLGATRSLYTSARLTKVLPRLHQQMLVLKQLLQMHLLLPLQL